MTGVTAVVNFVDLSEHVLSILTPKGFVFSSSDAEGKIYGAFKGLLKTT